METDATSRVVWRLTTGAEPCAVKAASTVLNGGDEATGHKVLRLVPTQLPRSGFRQQVSASVVAPRKLGVSGRVKVPVG